MGRDKTKPRLYQAVVSPNISLREALIRLDQAGTGALLLAVDGGKLYGLLTDGDIRRAVLRGVSLDDRCGPVGNRTPITGSASISARDALHLMTRHDINHLPLVDEERRVTDFLLRRDLAVDEDIYMHTRKRLDSMVVAPELALEKAIQQLDQAGTGALAVCGEGRKLVGLLTDGDIRRAILRGVSMHQPCADVAKQDPVVVRQTISDRDALRLMVRNQMDHLPVVDADMVLIDFVLRRDFTGEAPLASSAVVVAGGFGTRLRPLTERIPKPMLPVGDRPILERTIQLLRRSGIRDVHLTTHYLPEAIREYFGNGDDFGVRLTYSNEEEPLGTAGGLRRFADGPGPLVVINGDILTGVSFRNMLVFHRTYGADLTVGVRKYQLNVPFGVVECDDVYVRALREKPSLTLFVNAGVYVLEPSACACIPENSHFDMTDLVEVLIKHGRPVVSFPIIEYWQDVGRHEDYLQAQEDAHNGRI